MVELVPSGYGLPGRLCHCICLHQRFNELSLFLQIILNYIVFINFQYLICKINFTLIFKMGPVSFYHTFNWFSLQANDFSSCRKYN